MSLTTTFDNRTRVRRLLVTAVLVTLLAPAGATAWASGGLEPAPEADDPTLATQAPDPDVPVPQPEPDGSEPGEPDQPEPDEPDQPEEPDEPDEPGVPCTVPGEEPHDECPPPCPEPEVPELHGLEEGGHCPPPCR